jgi:hypothetical protein
VSHLGLNSKTMSPGCFLAMSSTSMAVVASATRLPRKSSRREGSLARRTALRLVMVSG